ncbi:YidB family protein [Roseomonas sp. CCTCC AB2023176]|uniref:YidB family protein n=1 Tax=Roseomonas sp. CCTCC AB2023176 TaxID=3342640 RepID=UPI0035E09276
MTALLGVLAVAGYQNRDKLGEMLGNLTGGHAPDPNGPSAAGASATAGATAGVTGAGGIGGFLSEGIRDLVDRFRQVGHGDAAESWVAHGPNRAVAPAQVETAIGGDTLDALTRQTGLPREEIIARLTRELPDAVDRYTPDGRLPSADGPGRAT